MIEVNEIGESTIDEYQKSQMVRLYDVFLLAPFLFYIAMKRSRLQRWEQMAVLVIAIGTLVYNARNYLINENK